MCHTTDFLYMRLNDWCFYLMTHGVSWYCWYYFFTLLYTFKYCSIEQIHPLFPLSLSLRVAVIPHIPAGRSLKITLTSRVEGRYVIVSLPGSRKVLMLCEVEVYGYRAPTGENKILGQSQDVVFSVKLQPHFPNSCGHPKGLITWRKWSKCTSWS